MIAKAAGSKLYLRILEIELESKMFQSLQYTITGEDSFYSSKDSESLKGFESMYLFDLHEGNKVFLNVTDFKETFGVKIYANDSS